MRRKTSRNLPLSIPGMHTAMYFLVHIMTTGSLVYSTLTGHESESTKGIKGIIDEVDGKDERSKYVFYNKVYRYKRKVYTNEVLLSMDKYKINNISSSQISNYILLAV